MSSPQVPRACLPQTDHTQADDHERFEPLREELQVETDNDTRLRSVTSSFSQAPRTQVLRHQALHWFTAAT